MFICKKTYSDIPFAHRQHKHEGHCAQIHGHNWSITLTFACKEIDANGFVIDFGKLRYIKNWIDEHLDHACLFNQDDTDAQEMLAHFEPLFKTYLLPSCSCEGIAQHLHQIFDRMVRSETGDRVWITSVEITEDAKNSALYTD